MTPAHVSLKLHFSIQKPELALSLLVTKTINGTHISRNVLLSLSHATHGNTITLPLKPVIKNVKIIRPTIPKLILVNALLSSPSITEPHEFANNPNARVLPNGTSIC